MIRRQPGGMSAGAWLGMASMAVLGVAGGALALIAAFAVGFGGAGEIVVFAVFAGLTVIPATILWLIGNRHLRAGAIGLAAAFLILTYVVYVSHPWDTMNDEEVERAKADVLAAGHPAFYLGDEVDGYPLNDYFLDSDEVIFHYGECHPDPEQTEGGCVDWDVRVDTSWGDVTIGGDAIAGCVRQEPVAGVPTVYLHDEQLGSDEVALFTGDSQVTFDVEAQSSLEEKLQIARRVRQVGESEAATSLPPPTPHILAYVERHCTTGQ